MSGILSGIVVLDLTRFFSGPQATLFLAGMGAEVIKIDDPETGDPTAFAPPFAGPEGVSLQRRTDKDMGLAYLKRARGKKSVTLNLKSAEGLAIFKRLVSQADVVVENFSAGVASRLGVDYENLREVNPRIISCSLTGYGSTGPDRSLKAYDLMVQASVGLMSITGKPGSDPVKAGSPISDAVAGVFAASGITAALLHRERTGEGQAIDVAMSDCLFSLVFDEPLDCYRELGLAYQQGSRIMRFSPFNAYRSQDGWIALGTATAAEWTALVDLIGGEDRFSGPEARNVGWRIAHNDEIDSLVSRWTAQHATSDLLKFLEAVKIPCSPVRTIDEVLAWEQLRSRAMIEPVWNPLSESTVGASAAGFPVKFSRSPASYARSSPLPGEHTNDILRRMAGLTDDAIATNRAMGVV